MELAEQVARLADATERTLERMERRHREQQAARLEERWGAFVPPAGMGVFLGSIPGLAARFDRVVPDEFTAATDDGELMIACPCGEEPTVRAGRLKDCSCGRWFLHDGKHVHVALSPTATPPDDDVAAAVPAD